ncbi:hypothetical protein ABT090_25265 [Streptomyces asoensis]|uniref:hypothetical protein n=1 Tax=Streptomyces asoensis TaxID=249586 RepID=UPI00331B9440
MTAVTWSARAPHLTLEDVVYRHVEAEGPIHRLVLHRHIAEVKYEPRVTAWGKHSADAVVSRLTEEGRIVETNDFLDLPNRPCRAARWPLPGLTRRPVEHVAPAERQRALLGLVEDRPRRLSAEQTLAAAATFFGWSPRTGSAPARLMSDLYRLRDSGTITGWPDKLESVDGS